MGEARRRKLAGTYPAETEKGERVCSECRIPTPPYVALPDGKHRPGVCEKLRAAVVEARAQEAMATALDTSVR